MELEIWFSMDAALIKFKNTGCESNRCSSGPFCSRLKISSCSAWTISYLTSCNSGRSSGLEERQLEITDARAESLVTENNLSLISSDVAIPAMLPGQIPVVINTNKAPSEYISSSNLGGLSCTCSGAAYPGSADGKGGSGIQ